jgi:LacI family transcriptional regulator
MGSDFKRRILTQKEIAKNLGISLVTVNRAMNDSLSVSPEMKKRILEYADQKGYVPHRASQVLLRNKVRTIAVFSSSYPEYFWDDVHKGVEMAAEQIKVFNYEVHYHRIPDLDTRTYLDTLEREIRRGLDAVALVNQRIFDMDAIIARIEKAKLPYIFYNTDGKQYRRLCYIGSDYYSCGRLAANVMSKALVVKKKARVLAIGTSHKRKNKPDINAERLKGFLDVMKEQHQKIEIHIELIASNSKIPWDKQIHNFLKNYESKVDGVYFVPSVYSSYLRSLEKINFKNAFTIRPDIDELALEYLEKNLLSAVIYQDPVLQGYRAVRVLEHILETKNLDSLEDIEISHSVIYRENSGFLQREPPSNAIAL